MPKTLPIKVVLTEETEELRRFKDGALQELHEVEEILAEALGYPYDKNYGWVTGEHTTITLAMEAKRRIRDLEEASRCLE
jgi:hypothetical protein